MAERQKAPRGRNPVVDKARKSDEWLQSGFGDFFEAAEQYNPPEGEVTPNAEAVFDGALAGAVQTHGRRSRAMYGQHYDRKEVAKDEREARWNADQQVETRAAQPAAAGLTKEAKAEQAKQLKAQAEAVVGQYTPAELEAMKDAILEKEVNDAPAGAFSYEEPEDESDYSPSDQGNAFFDPRAESIRSSQLQAEAERLQLEDEANGLNAPGFSGMENEPGAGEAE